MRPSQRPLWLPSNMLGERKKDGYIVTSVLHFHLSSPILRAMVCASSVRLLDGISGLEAVRMAQQTK